MELPAVSPATTSPRKAKAAGLRVVVDNSSAQVLHNESTPGGRGSPMLNASDIPEVNGGQESAVGKPSNRLPGEAEMPNNLKRYRDSATIKGPWTDGEDELLRKLVEKYSPSKWSLIAAHMENRNGKQCRERWLNHLSEGIRKGSWTEDEERLLVDAHQVIASPLTEPDMFKQPFSPIDERFHSAPCGWCVATASWQRVVRDCEVHSGSLG